MDLPILFTDRMKRLLREEYEDFYRSFCSEKAVKGIRVNTEKLSCDAFVKNSSFSLEEIPYVRGGFIIPLENEAGKHAYHHAGAYYMQDPGAMAAVAAIPDEVFSRRGIRVLDLCAAPGGKTMQLASRMSKDGIILSNEYNGERSRILAGNVERMGLKNVVVTNLDSAALAREYIDTFDLVVCDAPCSGEGMFRKNDRAIEEWSEQNVQMCAQRQKEILGNAAKCVAPGGYLLYSTCTYSVEENEGVVADFLSRNGEFSLVPCADAVVQCTSDGVTEDFSEDFALCRRFYPHVSKGEGQFAALLRRSEDARTERRKPVKDDGFSRPSKPDLAATEAFLRETLGHTLPALGVRRGYVHTLPVWETNPLPALPLGAVALGVSIGEVRKGRIVPHHQFFMAYGNEMKSRVELDVDDVRVARYLAGEEIDVPAECKGYTAVLLRVGDETITLGGGKASLGRLKNYYPKGLRVR